MATDVTYGSNIDLAGNELRNARAHVLTAAPTGTAGKFYYNSTDNKLYWHNGSTWVSAGGAELANLSGQASAFGQSAADGSAATAARSDHYHALPAHNAAAHSAIKLSDLAAPTADIAMGGYKITGLGAAAANGQAVRYEQVVGVYLALSGGTISGNLTVSGTLYSTSIYGQLGNDGSAFSWNGTYWSLPSVRPSVALHMNSFKITNMADGTAATDAVTKQQLDTKANTTHSHAIADVTNLQTTLDAKAPLASPALTGTPTAPTAAAGTNNTQIATTAYVDAAAATAVQGLDVKESVKVATTANITLSGTQTIDSVAVVVGDRVLVKDQSTGSANGIYVVASGAWTRATDFDTSAKVTPNAYCWVEQGGTQSDTSWVLTTNGPITLGTTNLVFTQFNALGQITAGAGLTKTGWTLTVGAGTGITVNADDVAIDTAVVARKYSEDLVDFAWHAGGYYEIMHGLNTRDIVVSVRQVGSPYGLVNVAVEANGTATCRIYFATKPTSGTYRATVIA